MILAVCLNPCIDKTITVNGVRLGEYNRIEQTSSDMSGKGVNVAVVLKRLGANTELLGFNFRDNARLLEELLKRENIKNRLIMCEGAVRTNIKLIDLSNGELTELNERGSRVEDDRLSEMLACFENKSADAAFAVMSGSIPAGCRVSAYAEMIEKAKCCCVLDCAGEAFAAGVEARPYMIKPNRRELEGYLATRLDTVEQCLDGALEMIKRGVGLVCVSMGGDGALLTDGKRAYFAPPLKVKVRSSVGAGDSMTAGICMALESGLSLKEAFACGTAAATACLLSTGTGLLTCGDYNEILKKVTVKEIRI